MDEGNDDHTRGRHIVITNTVDTTKIEGLSPLIGTINQSGVGSTINITNSTNNGGVTSIVRTKEGCTVTSTEYSGTIELKEGTHEMDIK